MKRFLLFALWFMSLAAWADAPPTLTINGATWSQCAAEDGNCTWTGGGTRIVAFGDGPPDDSSLQIAMTSGPVASGGGCFVGGLFGSDPAPGFNKGCYTSGGGSGGNPPTDSLTASANNVAPGTAVTLTWTSSNATSCTFSGFTGSGLAGSKVVNPTVTTTYGVTCSGTVSPPATSQVTVTVQSQCSNNGFTVGGVSTVSGGTANGTIWADTPDTNQVRIFGNNQSFSIQLTASVPAADTVQWSVTDMLGVSIASGSFPVPSGVSTSTLPVASSTAGFFKLAASTVHAGGSLPARGTEPAGMISFGVLPPAGVVPAVTYAAIDQHRFGMQGFNDNFGGLAALGVTDTIDDREQSAMEPNAPNTYVPSVNDLDPFYVSHPSITRLVRLDGIPAWNSSTDQFNDSYSLPTNLTEYGQFMAKVGTDTKLIHDQTYPSARHNYYQVTWEPSLGWPQSQSATFLQLYQSVYPNLHSTDPLAVVMGPAEPFPNNGSTASGNRITATAGLCSVIDGVTTHGYYAAPAQPSTPPEFWDGADAADAANALDNEMIGLRSIMQACKPNMLLFNTEVGIPYDLGVTYQGVTNNELYAQAVVGVRTHLIILGEGAQRTYYFFAEDFNDNGLSGYGALFDLQNPNGANGDTIMAPKPEAVGFAALSRIIDGTNTLGRYNLPQCVASQGCVHGYAFQQLSTSTVISALWYHNNASWSGPSSFSSTASKSYTLAVDSAGTSGTVKVLDFFGNASTMNYTNGQVTLALTETPIYVVSSNPTFTKTQVTAPVGYTGQ